MGITDVSLFGAGSADPSWSGGGRVLSCAGIFCAETFCAAISRSTQNAPVINEFNFILFS
jgi:hypothetical protein